MYYNNAYSGHLIAMPQPIYGDDVEFTEDTNGIKSGFDIDIDVEYDTSKLKLKWYIDGVEDPSLENQTQVTSFVKLFC